MEMRDEGAVKAIHEDDGGAEAPRGLGRSPRRYRQRVRAKLQAASQFWAGVRGGQLAPLMLVTPSLEMPGVHAQWRQKVDVASGAGET